MFTFTLLGLFGDFPQDQGVGRGDDEQGQGVQGDQVKQVVRQLVVRRREEVEGHALGEARVLRVGLHVEYDALGKRKKAPIHNSFNGLWF